MSELYQQAEPADQLEGMIKPAIYSKRVIYVFSVFFSSIFGGVLLMQNLKDIGKRKEANIVLLVSVLLAVATVVIANFIKGRSVALICNTGSAALLTEYFYRKYFPDDADYDKKKIWKPLIIGLAITIFFIWFIFWAQDQVTR